MNKQEFELVNFTISEPEVVISPDDLENKSDRTLLYGYTCDRDTWHVYIKDEVIHTIWYNSREDDIVICELPNYISNEQYIPNKRLYPECCDFEFCSLLKNKEVHLPFTTWDDNRDREEEQFYGLINK